MASYTCAHEVHATLSGVTVDDITASAAYGKITVFNRSASPSVYFTTDGSTPSTAGKETFVVPANSARSVPINAGAPTSKVVKIIGNANDYSVSFRG